MYKQTLAVLCVTASIAGCAITPENPVDFVTYRNEPLVKDVKDDMTREQVLNIGGPPSSTVDRPNKAGRCNNYVLNRDGKEQTYYVSFNSADRVDSKGFMTCAQHHTNQKTL